MPTDHARVRPAISAGVPPGDYTVTWLPAPGWDPPSPATVTQTTRPYLVKTLRGYYTEATGQAAAGGQDFGLLPNTPNPFNPTTTISLTMPVASEWSITIYNITGQVVKTFDLAKTGVDDVLEVPAGERDGLWRLQID